MTAPAGTGAPAKGPVTLRYMAWFFQDFSGIDDLIRIYQEKRPNVTIQKDYVPGGAEFTTKQAANFVAGTASGHFMR